MPCNTGAGQTCQNPDVDVSGSQLETRAIALLKKLQSTAHQSPLTFAGRSKARRSSAGRSRGGEALYSLNDGPPPRRRMVRLGLVLRAQPCSETAMT